MSKLVRKSVPLLASRLITRVGKHFCYIWLSTIVRSCWTVYLVKSSRQLHKPFHHIFHHKNIIIDFFCKTEPISSCLHISLRLKVSLFLDITTTFFLRLEDILITDSFAPGNLFVRLANEFKRNKGKLFACQLILKRICCCTERNFARFEASTDSRLDVFRDCNCFETIVW